MSEAIILGVAVAGGLACPLHMWWSHRRGKEAACSPRSSETADRSEIAVLRARQERLRELIAEHRSDAVDAPAEAPGRLRSEAGS